jgi:arylsulfatase A-like enzyme
MSSQRPNLIIITTDQQRCDSLSCYGSDFTHTPNLDRIAAQGALCTRAYCANPVCTPARASIFSGQYLSRHGAWNVGMTVPERTPMLSHSLRQAGYRTHYVGKAHFQAFSGGAKSRESHQGWENVYPDWHGPYYGFDTVELSLGHGHWGLFGHYGAWLKSQVSAAELKRFTAVSCAGSGTPFGGEACDWDIPTRLHSSVWTADRAVAFLTSRNAREPFFMAVGFQDPHHPHCLPRDYDDRLDAAEVPLPRYREGELDDKPPHFRLAREGNLETSAYRGDYPFAGQHTGFDYRQVSERDARLGRAYYYSMVKLMDREVGRILDCLEEQGLADNTLVVFTTDHGELLGDHGLWMKGPFHYEELIRIPLIMRWPRHVVAGNHIQQVVSQVDIAPTILSAFAVESAAELDGVNMMPLLENPGTTAERDHVVVECVDDPRGLRLKTVVTADRKLTCYHGQSFGELYDLTRDPGEICNLWDHPDYLGDRARLTGLIADHLERLEPRAVRYGYA